jgi:hypothetical protein
MCECMKSKSTTMSFPRKRVAKEREPMSMSMSFARKRIAKERQPIKLNLSSHPIGSVKAGKSMKSGRPRPPHSVISQA